MSHNDTQAQSALAELSAALDRLCDAQTAQASANTGFDRQLLGLYRLSTGEATEAPGRLSGPDMPPR